MQKRIFFFLFLLVKCVLVFGQAVSTDPAFPTTDQPVTIIFDITQTKDSRASGLLNKTSDVYLWAGAGTSATSAAFEYVPTGQTTWGQPFEPGRMTSLGNNKWQITITPRTYFNIPAGKEALKLGLLLKNGAGTAQTEDFIIAVYPLKLNAAFQEPADRSLFVEAHATIPIRAAASAKSNISLRLGDAVLATAANEAALTYALPAGADAGERKMVVLEAKTNTETARDTFFFTVKPQPVVAELPAGMKDGINYIGSTKVLLSLFAPGKDFVYVIGEFNKWEALPEYLMKNTPAGDRYWLELDKLPAGQEVAFQYLVNGTLPIADPYTEKILDPQHDPYLSAASYPGLKPFPAGASGIVSVLETNQVPYQWKVPNFQRPDPQNLVVYELLVRDFVATRNYKTLTDTLTYLKRLGINAIELMPIMEFSGNDSWGYNPIFYFAPDKAYGTENDLKAFIDKCHENGIAVILDMVLNQADYEFPYVKMYWDGNKPSADNPFFNQTDRHPFGVFFDFNHEAPATQAFVQRVSQYWLQEYKFDGYRYDLSKGFTQKNSGTDVGAWGAYDAGRVAIWKRIKNQIRAYDPSAYIILEHFADNAEEKELANEGFMFWGNLSHDYRTAAKGSPVNLHWASYKARGWNNPNLVAYLESHDEERLVYDVKQNGLVQGNYNTRVTETALERAKLAAAFLLPIPGPKLIWQFGELGYDVPIDFNGRTSAKPLHWEYLQDPNRRKLFGVYAELNKLKLTQPAFQTKDFTLDLANPIKRITLNHASMQVYILGNFGMQVQTPEADFPATGMWYDYFTGQEVAVNNQTHRISLQPGEFHIYTTQKLPVPEAQLVPWGNPFTYVTAVADAVLDESLALFPNPTADALYLHLKNRHRGKIVVQLQNMQGQAIRNYSIIKGQDLLQKEINLNFLAAGVYFLKIWQGDTMVVKRIVKH